MKYIITCDDPSDIIIGMNCVKSMIKDGFRDCIYAFDNGQSWHARKTKTGFSARMIKPIQPDTDN